MVDDIGRCIYHTCSVYATQLTEQILTSKAIQCARRMKVRRQASPDIDVLSNTLHPCSLMEVTSSDCLPMATVRDKT